MAVVRRTVAVSATWLIKKAADMAAALGKRSGASIADRKIIDGYLILAKKTQGIPDRPGIPLHQQPAQVKNSIKLSALVLDLPAFLCLIGRYLVGGQDNHSRYYIQTLQAGRDSYLSGALSSVQPAQENPRITAGMFNRTALGATANQYTATRYWGLAQSFNGAGAVHCFSAVSTAVPRWPMSYAGVNDEFIWRLVVVAPTVVRFSNNNVIPQTPVSPIASWTLDIAESALAPLGGFAITRVLDAPVENFELNWEAAQYPWMATGRPATFVTEEGEQGFRISVVCHATYEAGGPYYWYGTPDRPVPEEGSLGSWSEGNDGFQLGGVPSGAKGLWAADIEVVGQSAQVVNSYKIFAGSEDRTPLLRDRRQIDPVNWVWYLNNLVYRSPMATVVNDDGARTSIMIGVTFVEKTEDPYQHPDNLAAFEFKGKLFTDITWLDNGSLRRQNLAETAMTRGTFHPDRSGLPYNGSNIAFDISQTPEQRFTIGADTDGSSVVFPVFSAFRPGDMPVLRVYVATRDGVRVGYSGTPGFTMCVARGTGEQTIWQYGTVDFPGPGLTDSYGEWITLPAPFDHVTYIGNKRYMFYVSHQISTRPADNFFWAPEGTIAVATYNEATDEVRLAGVIDPQMTQNGFGSEGPITAEDAWLYVSETSAYTVPVFANPKKLGKIEVVRPESNGYDPEDPSAGGHPATLIASDGKGQPGLNLVDFDGDDIRQGVTWISYDSGATWTQFLGYGSPAGTIHCGNIAQARAEPVVRI